MIFSQVARNEKILYDARWRETLDRIITSSTEKIPESDKRTWNADAKRHDSRNTVPGCWCSDWFCWWSMRKVIDETHVSHLKGAPTAFSDTWHYFVSTVLENKKTHTICNTNDGCLESPGESMSEDVSCCLLSSVAKYQNWRLVTKTKCILHL